MTDELETIEISETLEEAKSNGGVPVRQQLILVAVILLLIFGSTVSTVVISGIKEATGNTPQAVPYTEPIETVETDTQIKPFSEVEIVGKAAYVWDIQNQRALFKKNENESLPLASVAKLMTALVAHEILSENEVVAISDSAIKQEGNSGLLANEQFDRLTLSDLVLISSSNDGAFALASVAGSELDSGGANSFVEAMNVRAEELGLYETVFYNPTGLDLSTTEAGAYGSAKDISFLLEYIVRNNPSILESTRDLTATVVSRDGLSHEADNTNYYINDIPALIGSKTGYTDLAGGNLVIAYDAGLNRPMIIAVLGSTQSNRFTDVLNLIDATNEYLSQ